LSTKSRKTTSAGVLGRPRRALCGRRCRKTRHTAPTSASSSSSASIRRSTGYINASGASTTPNKMTSPNARCPSRHRVIAACVDPRRPGCKQIDASVSYTARHGADSPRAPGKFCTAV
jgi:hypothetical protein